MKNDFTTIPDKETKPFSYHKWKDLGLLKATPLERLIMLELNQNFGAMEWLTRSEPIWDRKDMRLFVKDLVKKINTELGLKK